MRSLVTGCHAVDTGFCDSGFLRKLLVYIDLKIQCNQCHTCHNEKDKDSIKQ